MTEEFSWKKLTNMVLKSNSGTQLNTLFNLRFNQCMVKLDGLKKKDNKSSVFIYQASEQQNEMFKYCIEFARLENQKQFQKELVELNDCITICEDQFNQSITKIFSQSKCIDSCHQKMDETTRERAYPLIDQLRERPVAKPKQSKTE